jgi:predicted  nucleic acid-binding Zn-ribbon protein
MTEVSILKEENKMLKYKLNAVMIKNQELLDEIERLKQEINDGWET